MKHFHSKPNLSQWDRKFTVERGTFFFLFQLIDIILSLVRVMLAMQNLSSSGHSILLATQSHKSEKASLKKRANQQQQLTMGGKLQLPINLLHLYLISVYTLTIKINSWHWDCSFECLTHIKGLTFFSLWSCLLGSKTSSCQISIILYCLGILKFIW